MFQSGSLKCKLHNIKMKQGLNEPYEIPVPWFLIQHPKGNVVIDGLNKKEFRSQNSGVRICSFRVTRRILKDEPYPSVPQSERPTPDSELL